MKKKKIKKYRPFAKRLSMRILLALFVANALTIAAVLTLIVLTNGVQSNLQYGQTVAWTIDKLNMLLEDTEKSAAYAVEDIENNIDHPEKFLTFLEQELRGNQQMRGCFVAFEPNYYAHKGRWFEPYVVRRDSDEIETMQAGTASNDYFQKEWYTKGKESANGYWSDPYISNDSTLGKICSYVKPVHDKEGNVVGVLGVDISLNDLTEQLRHLDSRTNYLLTDDSYDDEDYLDVWTYTFIIDHEGHYIVQPNSLRSKNDNFLEDLKASQDSVDNTFFQKMTSGETGLKKLQLVEDETFILYYTPIGPTGWTLAMAVPIYITFIWGIVIAIFIFIVMLVSMLVVFVVSRFTIHRAAKPLKYLTNSAKAVARGHFNTPLPQFKYNDEITQLRNAFESMQHSLSQYIEELKETTTSKASIESELRIAHGIQMSMLPKTFPAFPDRSDIDLFAQVTPAKAVGGDLYDFFIRDEKLFFSVGDVSGKGVPASLVMAVTRSLFRNIAAHTSNPSHIVTTLNNALVEGNDANMFVTLFVGVLDLPTGRLRYCNAGHDAPILVDSSTTLPVESNLPVGVATGITFNGQETTIAPGAMVFLFTDGLTEAENASYELFGMHRIMEVINRFNDNPTPSPEVLISLMTDAVHHFVGDMEQSDDLTMLAVKYNGQQATVNTIDSSLTLPNDVQEVPQLAAFVDEVCEAVGFDMTTTMQMNLAIEEAVVNVMDYAYPEGESGEVRIRALADKDTLRIIISDDGKPFDPTTQEEVDTTLSVEERSIGGLGIHLVRQIMDSINYERIDNCNVFTMSKNIASKQVE